MEKGRPNQRITQKNEKYSVPGVMSRGGTQKSQERMDENHTVINPGGQKVKSLKKIANNKHHQGKRDPGNLSRQHGTGKRTGVMPKSRNRKRANTGEGRKIRPVKKKNN